MKAAKEFKYMTNSEPKKFPMIKIAPARIALSEEMNPQVAEQYASIQGDQQPEEHIDIKIEPRQNSLSANFPLLLQPQQDIEEQGQQ
jgi:hypothetical protein